MVSLYIWLSIYTNYETLRILWKFNLSSRGVLGRIYVLSIEVLKGVNVFKIKVSRKSEMADLFKRGATVIKRHYQTTFHWKIYFRISVSQLPANMAAFDLLFTPIRINKWVKMWGLFISRDLLLSCRKHKSSDCSFEVLIFAISPKVGLSKAAGKPVGDTGFQELILSHFVIMHNCK